MPIRVGSRLEQLRALRRRIDVEIELEQRNVWRSTPGRPDAPAATRSRKGVILTAREVTAIMVRLGVPSRVIRAWGAEHGYIVGPRGPLPGEVVQAYDVAHQGGTE